MEAGEGLVSDPRRSKLVISAHPGAKGQPKPPLCKGRWQKSMIFDGGVAQARSNRLPSLYQTSLSLRASAHTGVAIRSLRYRPIGRKCFEICSILGYGFPRPLRDLAMTSTFLTRCNSTIFCKAVELLRYLSPAFMKYLFCCTDNRPRRCR